MSADVLFSPLRHENSQFEILRSLLVPSLPPSDLDAQSKGGYSFMEKLPWTIFIEIVKKSFFIGVKNEDEASQKRELKERKKMLENE